MSDTQPLVGARAPSPANEREARTMPLGTLIWVKPFAPDCALAARAPSLPEEAARFN